MATETPHTIRLDDGFDARSVDDVYAAARAMRAREIVLDCSAVTRWPTARAALLAHLIRRLQRRGLAWSVAHAPVDVREELEYFLHRRSSRRRVSNDPGVPLVDSTLARTVRVGRALRALLLMLQDVVFWTITGPFFRHGFRSGRALFEINERGLRSLGIVMLVAFIMGLILALQAAAQLRDYGALWLIPAMVGRSVVYELGPLMSAVLIAGRSGSSITAEIGSMVTSEEIDALRAMGVSVTKYVIVPKFVALIIALPCLTLFADLIGIFGGYLVSVLQIGLSSPEYIERTLNAISIKDMLIGLTKSAADGVVIASIAVYHGLTTSGGAEGIGRSTTRSVVHSIVMIAVAHLFFTFLFYQTGHALKITP